MITGYTSLGTIIAKIYRTTQSNDEVNFSDCAEFAAEALNLIGAHGIYDEIPACLNITNGKSKLPLGFHKLSNITYNNSPMYWSSNSVATNYSCSNCQIPVCNSGTCDNTFYVNNSYLVTSIKDEDQSVCIIYLGIHTDDEGIPMIPDDSLIIKAVEAFIIHKLDYANWRKGKITDKVFEESKREWLFYCPAAKGAANAPSLAQIQNLGNIFRRLIPMRNDYRAGFKNINDSENFNF